MSYQFLGSPKSRWFAAAAFRIGSILSALCKQISGVALAAITVICTLNAGSRYLFNHAFSWAEEAMVYLMVVVIFLGSGSVTWLGVHLKLDLILRKFANVPQRSVVVLTALVTSGLMILFAHNSWRVVSRLWRYNQTSDALGIPMWIPQATVMAGFYLIALMTILRLLSRDPLLEPVDFTEEEPKL